MNKVVMIPAAVVCIAAAYIAIHVATHQDVTHQDATQQDQKMNAPVTHNQKENMKFTLPPLPYAYDALEPHIDAMTMEIHHTRHHQAYINNLNAAIESEPSLSGKSLEDLLINLDAIPASVRTTVRNNGGGHYNHSMFWKLMRPNGGGEPHGKVAELITKHFGTFAAFQEEFNAKAKTVFGSGWAWACIDKDGKLVVIALPNQDCPISQGLQPILCLDVWEHAYYLKYQNKRPDYITAWWHVINWDQVAENLNQIK